MRMIICGMGEVGRHLARELAEYGHDVVAMDTSKEALLEVESTMDVLTLRGHAGLPSMLEQAGVRLGVCADAAQPPVASAAGTRAVQWLGIGAVSEATAGATERAAARPADGPSTARP